MKNHNFKSYKVNYHIEYEIKSDNDTSVVIKTKRIDYIFAREEDAEEIANLNYSCFNEINVKDKVIYDKIINVFPIFQGGGGHINVGGVLHKYIIVCSRGKPFEHFIKS